VEVPYQPLRVPAGWRIDWNTLSDLDPTEENVRAGFFGGSSLFSATDEQRRLWVDVEWRPEDDPAGEFKLRVEYAPWERTEKGRRRKSVPLDFRGARVVHEFRTRSRAESVRELEAVLRGRPEWVEGH
jgi:hypothetical protein